MRHLEQYYLDLKERYPNTNEGQLWKMAAHNYVMDWMRRDITFREYLESLFERIERYFTKR